MMEKNHLNSETNVSDKKMLGNKRVQCSLSENFIFRKALTNNLNGNYEKIASIYRNIFSFNWDDEKISKMKNSPLPYMSPSAFWFYISSQYFPFLSNEFFNNSEELKTIFDILIDKFSYSKSIKKNTHLYNKKNFLYDVVSLIYPDLIKEEVINLDKENKLLNENISYKYRFELNNSKKSVSVDKMICDFEAHLKDIQYFNEQNLNELSLLISQNKDFISTDNPDKEHTIDFENILTDIKYYSDVLQKYHVYLIEKHNQNIKIKENSEVLTKFEDEQNKTIPDDVVCAICNSGDYEDNDLIVFCSTCNIAVHQNCYGILKIPKDDWICDSCYSFGLEGSKKLECILCPVRGGALKITNLKKKSSFVKYIHSLGKKNKALFEVSNKKDFFNSNNNTGYSSCNNGICNSLNGNNEIISNEENLLSNINNDNGCMKSITEDNDSNPNLTPEKRSVLDSNRANEINESENKINSKETSKKKDKNKKKKKCEYINQGEDESKQKLLRISKENEWVHLSCALWIAEVKIQKYDTKSDISDIENIDKKRFSETCNICKLNNNGVTEKCYKENCNLKFHIECARINKYHLEVITFQNENKYVVYCEFHRPQKLMKNIELRNQRNVDEIIAYSKILEKCYEQINCIKKGESLKTSNLTKKNINRLSLKSKYKKKDKDKVIRQVKQYAKEISKFFFILKKKKQKIIPKKDEQEVIDENNNNNNNNENTQFEIVKKPGIKINYEDTLNPAIFPWNKITVEGLTTKEIFSLYKKTIPSSYIFSKVILNKAIKKGQEFIVNIINDKDNTQRIERACPDNNLYCYCRKQYSEEFMVGCSEGDENCVVGGWIHPYCDDRLKNLTQDKIQSLEFTCSECLKKKETSLSENLLKAEKENSLEGLGIEKENENKDLVIEEENEKNQKYQLVKEEKDVYYFKINEVTTQSSTEPKADIINKIKDDCLDSMMDNS